MPEAKLSVTLPPDWALEQRERPDQPYTFTWQNPRAVGSLQFSLGFYRSGQIPNPSPAQLEGMAREFGTPHGLAPASSSESGVCKFGVYGSALYSGADLARLQVWFMSNGRDFIMATHTCELAPLPEEVVAAQGIVQAAHLTQAPSKPWWRIW